MTESTAEELRAEASLGKPEETDAGAQNSDVQQNGFDADVSDEVHLPGYSLAFKLETMTAD